MSYDERAGKANIALQEAKERLEQVDPLAIVIAEPEPAANPLIHLSVLLSRLMDQHLSFPLQDFLMFRKNLHVNPYAIIIAIYFLFIFMR